MNLQHIKPSRFTLILGAFLAFLVMVPSLAHAQQQDDCTSGTGAFQNRYTNNVQSAVQRVSQIKHDHLYGLKMVNAKLDYCLDMIENAIDLMMTTGNLRNILYNILMQIVLGVISQACQAALAIIGSAINSALSLMNSLCLPIPQLHLPGFQFHFPGGHCTGVNLFPITLAPMPNPNTPQTPASWQIWGGRVKMQ